jgi:hypothetical protein
MSLVDFFKSLLQKEKPSSVEEGAPKTEELLAVAGKKK